MAANAGKGLVSRVVCRNRYQSPDIDHLKSAVRDAQALHALFTDNLGETATLIVDEEATRAQLVDELTQLATVSTGEDVVVIGFSGHGSNTHEVAQSGLAVRSAVRVAATLRHLHPTEVNRASLIGAAQLTTELDDLRLPVNT